MTAKKVLFINPPRLNEIEATLPTYVDEEKGVTPPLGILSVASYVKTHTNCEVLLIDAQAEQLDYNTLAKKIMAYKPDIICITAMSMTVKDVIETIRISKNILPESLIIIGGPHANCYPIETARWKNVDFVFYGEGEIAFTAFLNNMDNNTAISQIKGLVCIDKNNNLIDNGRADYINDMDSLSYPDRDLIPTDRYSSMIMPRQPVTSLLTSRGCPFRCNYCDRPSVGKVFRARSVESVVDEITDCLRLSIRNFLFYDDTFTVQRKRVIQICKAIIELHADIEFNIRSRVDTVDEEMLYYLKQAGCIGIQYGVESGSQKILDRMNKGITLEQIKETFRTTKKQKIQTIAYFMLGNPGEDRDDIRKTIDFMNVINPDYVMISIFSPYPKTRSYEEGLRLNLYEDVWLKLAQDPAIDFEMPVWTENFSIEELTDIMLDTYKKFYFNKKRIFKQICTVKSFKDFIRKAKVAARIFNK
jgi:radical SAM superfamily enzyme YgiQ (UPF0313 family)